MNYNDYIANIHKERYDLNLLLISERKSRSDPLNDFENFIEIYCLYKLGKYNTAYAKVEEFLSKKKPAKQFSWIKYQILLKMNKFNSILESPVCEPELCLFHSKARTLSDRSTVVRFNPVPVLDNSKFVYEQDEMNIFIKVFYKVFPFQLKIDFLPSIVTIIIDSDEKNDFFKTKINLFSQIVPPRSSYVVYEDYIHIKCEKACPSMWTSIIRSDDEDEDLIESVNFTESPNIIKCDSSFEKFLNNSEEEFRKRLESFGIAHKDSM